MIGLGLTQIDPLLPKICAKNDFYIFVPSDFDLWPLDLKFAPVNGVGRILVWGGPHRGAEGAEGVRCGEGVPGEGVWEEAVPPPQKIFDF